MGNREPGTESPALLPSTSHSAVEIKKGEKGLLCYRRHMPLATMDRMRRKCPKGERAGVLLKNRDTRGRQFSDRDHLSLSSTT